ncbi:MAG: SRPBCC family protein [Solirubrobacteraceae bacterium]
MSTVQTEITINAPIERVWETVMDPARLGDWVTIHKSVTDVSQQPLRKGATMDQTMQVRGLTFRVHWQLVSVDAPHTAQWEGGGPAHSNALIRYELFSAGDGQTTFRYINEFHPPGGRLGNIAGRMIVGATSEREAKSSLSRLKALLEAR